MEYASFKGVLFVKYNDFFKGAPLKESFITWTSSFDLNIIKLIFYDKIL